MSVRRDSELWTTVRSELFGAASRSEKLGYYDELVFALTPALAEALDELERRARERAVKRAARKARNAAARRVHLARELGAIENWCGADSPVAACVFSRADCPECLRLFREDQEKRAAPTERPPP